MTEDRNDPLRNRISRRKVLQVTGLTTGAAVGGWLLVGCGGGSVAPTATPGSATQAAPAGNATAARGSASAATGVAGRTPKRGGTLKMGLNQEAATIDPHKSRDIAGTQIKGLIYSQLLKYGKGNQLAPDLAEKYEAVDDKTYVFHLRKGVKFHDGQELTAADVKASYDRILKPETGASIYVYLRAIESVTVVDDYTVQFKLKQPQATFLAAMGYTGNYIAQKKKIDANVNFETDVVGTGPFMFVSRDPSVMTKVQRNPDYFLPGLPYLDAIELRPIFDDSARLNALYSGDVDLITYVSWAAMGDIEKNQKYLLQSNKQDGWVQLNFRVDRPPFTDVRIRQAINYAIDRQAIIDTATSKRGVANYGGIVPPWMWAYDKDIENTYQYNPAKAKQLLSDAGATNLKIECTTWPTDTELFGRPSVVIANQLKQVGIDVSLKTQPVAEWAQSRATGAYQMLVNGSLYDIPDPDVLSNLYHTSAGVMSHRFSDPEIDGLLDKARGLTDQAQRKPLYDQVQKRGLELAPFAWLFYREQGEGMQNFVQGHEYLGAQGANNTLLETWLDK